MTYRALYRAYRPQTFAEVVGQEHVTRTLQNALRHGRVGHAYLFAGPRGTGKTTMARLLAKAVNCDAPVDGAEPCNACEPCRTITEGSALDVIEIDAASNRGIDEIRDLRERVRYAPGRCPHKVYIIDEVHMLTDAAFNALLKTLEDPPANVIFVMATTDPQRVPATILSRCQRFDFHRLAPAQVVEQLQRVCAAEGLQADPRALHLIARHARGGLRDALSLLDQAAAMGEGGRIDADDLLLLLGTADEETLLALTRAALDGDLAAGLRVIDRAMSAGRDPRQLLRDWQEHLRHLLLLALDEGLQEAIPVAPEHLPELRRLAAGAAPDALLGLIDQLAEREQVMRWAPDGRIVLETAFLRAARLLAGQAGPSRQAPETRPGAQQRAEVDAPGAAPREAAAVAGTRADAQAAGAAAAPADAAAAVVAAWPQVRERIRRRDRRIHAWLEPARPRAAGPGRIELCFSPRDAFHRQMMESRDRLRLVEQAIAEVCGVRVRVHCATMEDDGGDAAGDQQPFGPPPPAGSRAEPPVDDVPAAPPGPRGAGAGRRTASAAARVGRDAPRRPVEKSASGQEPASAPGTGRLVDEALELFGGRLVEPKEGLT